MFHFKMISNALQEMLKRGAECLAAMLWLTDEGMAKIVFTALENDGRDLVSECPGRICHKEDRMHDDFNVQTTEVSSHSLRQQFWSCLRLLFVDVVVAAYAVA